MYVAVAWLRFAIPSGPSLVGQFGRLLRFCHYRVWLVCWCALLDERVCTTGWSWFVVRQTGMLDCRLRTPFRAWTVVYGVSFPGVSLRLALERSRNGLAACLDVRRQQDTAICVQLPRCAIATLYRPVCLAAGDSQRSELPSAGCVWLFLSTRKWENSNQNPWHACAVEGARQSLVL